MFDFIPEPSDGPADVPFFDDVTGADGWQGHSTTRSLESLKAEVISAMGRLGGLVVAFQRGRFLVGGIEREGFQIHYTLESRDSSMIPGRVDVAALPVRPSSRRQRSLSKRQERSLKMALYMLHIALNGLWFLQQLSPGYAGLMPWMLATDDGKTVGQLWTGVGKLLPPPDEFTVTTIKED